jgi:copper(I)-binding protein
MKYLLVLVGLLAGPVFAESDLAEPDHVYAIGGLEVLHPWAPAIDRGSALLFMELHNEGDAPVNLIGARLPDGPMGQLVGFSMKAGQMGYDPLPPIPVAPGKHLDLTPDGLAILFEGLTAPLIDGQHWEVVLQTSAGDLKMEVAVEPKGSRQHGHVGHSH